MISVDTNILFPSLESSHLNHQKAKEFLMGLKSKQVIICELVLIEIYQLVRNSTVCQRPLNAIEAIDLIQKLRTHPEWELVDYPGGMMNEVWGGAKERDFPRRRIFDLRLASSLKHYGVKYFATVNVKDFQGLNFDRVWNPFVESVGEDE